MITFLISTAIITFICLGVESSRRAIARKEKEVMDKLFTYKLNLNLGEKNE